MGALSWLVLATTIGILLLLVMIIDRLRAKSTLTITQRSSHRAALQEIGDELIARIKVQFGTINPDIPRRGRFQSKCEYFWIRDGLKFEHLERIVVTILLPSDMKSDVEMHVLRTGTLEPTIKEYLRGRPGVHIRLQIFLWPVKSEPSTSTIEFKIRKQR